MSKVCISGETYRPWKMIGMYVWGNIHTYLETRGMYVCQRYVYLGKHTYLENDRYVCMSGETYIPRKLEVCMYETYIPGKCLGYVCLRKHTYLENYRYMYVWVCVWGHIHT